MIKEADANGDGNVNYNGEIVLTICTSLREVWNLSEFFRFKLFFSLVAFFHFSFKPCRVMSNHTNSSRAI